MRPSLGLGENYDAQDRAWRRGRADADGGDCHGPLAIPAAEPDLAPFDETWRDAAMPLVFKSAELATITAPKIVQVETVKVVPEIVALPGLPEEKPVAKSKFRHVGRDVCRRKVKLYTAGRGGAGDDMGRHQGSRFSTLAAPRCRMIAPS